MSLRTLCKRAAALLAAVGLSACLAAGVSADDENSRSEPAPALQPTEVVADIPAEYDTPFQLEWGGGSLYQLKARLATMRCIANNIWLHDNGKWNIYNQYELPHDTFFIQQFKQQYEQSIPAGALWADCYRLCDFRYIDDGWFEVPCRDLEYINTSDYLNTFQYPISKTNFCNSDFNLMIQEKIFPILPIHPDTCIVRQNHTERTAAAWYRDPFDFHSNIPYPVALSHIVLYAPEHYYTSPNDLNPYQRILNKNIIIYFELHELCHANQDWHTVQALQSDMPVIAFSNHALWHTTIAGKEFIALTGFQNTNGELILPQGNIYRNIYSTNPRELSAGLCMSYLIEEITGTGNPHNEFTLDDANFDINTYLTPEIREWLETYMILPQIIEPEIVEDDVD